MKDPFVYKDTNILINKLDLKNQELLDQFESTMFQLSFMKILEEGFVVNSVNDVLKLHKLLFEEVYDWAGTARTINIKKQEPVLDGLSVNYRDKDNILKDLNNLNKTLINLNVKDNFIKDLTKLISKIWQIHPFREGNTRTITVFLYFLLKKYNLELNVDLIEKSSKYFRNSLVLASIGEYSEYNHLEVILNDAIFGDSKEIDKTKTKDNKYSKIKDFDLSKYRYNYHTKK